MGFWEQLEARRLPTAEVVLPLPDGDTATVVVRALPPAEWDALVALHPPAPTEVDRVRFDEPGMRAALLAVSVSAPDGSQRDPGWWAALRAGGGVPAGEFDTLFWAAVTLNDRSPQVDAGKG